VCPCPWLLRALAARLALGAKAAGDRFRAEEDVFRFADLPATAKRRLSLLRGFQAPVRLDVEGKPELLLLFSAIQILSRGWPVRPCCVRPRCSSPRRVRQTGLWACPLLLSRS